jgi:hypothetical protein
MQRKKRLPLPNNLVCADEECGRYGETRRFRGLEVDDDPVFVRFHYRQVARFLAPENWGGIGTGPLPSDSPKIRIRLHELARQPREREPGTTRRARLLRSLRQRILRIMTRSLLGSVTGRSALTWSAVTDAAPLPQAERTKVSTLAISSSVSCTRYGGMR